MSEEPLSCPLHANLTPKRYAYHLQPSPIKTGQMVICCCLNVGIDQTRFTKPRNTSSTFSWINTKDRLKRDVGVDITMAIAARFQRYCGNPTTTRFLCDQTTETIKTHALQPVRLSWMSAYSTITTGTAFLLRRSTTSAGTLRTTRMFR